ncbi:hypothetical protein D9M70_504400 [compost metagenome]
MHRSADDDAAILIRPAVAGIVAQLVQEHPHQILEAVALGKDLRALEEGACGKGFDRLQETTVARIVDEGADRRLAGFDLQCLGAKVGVLHEGKRGAHGVGRAGETVELHRVGGIAGGNGKHGIGGAEVEAQCLGHMVVSLRLASLRRPEQAGGAQRNM